MKSLKIILIGILSISFIGIANAQGDRQQNQPSTPASKITCEVKKEQQKVTEELTKALKKEVTTDKTIIIIVNDSAREVSLSIDTAKINLADIEKRLQDKGYVLLISEPVKEKAVETKLTLPEKYNPEIDEFLNREDVAVFNTQFQNFAEQEIHPRSRDYYLLIKNIHDLDELLANIGKRNIAQLSQIKNELEKARLQIETIKSFITLERRKVTDFLSESQKEYYRSLVNSYNELYEQIYPDD
jgi:hypothetical protein